MRKSLIIHGLVLVGLMGGMAGILFVMSFFVTLHPDAYTDGMMSVLFGFALYVVIKVVFMGLYRAMKKNEINTFDSLHAWYKQSGILDNIALGFMAITVINSVMMVTGIDQPKTGTFLYVHLLVRLLIVTLAVSFVMLPRFHAWLQARKTQEREPKTKSLKATIKWFYKDKPLIVASGNLFTSITVFLCVIMIPVSMNIGVFPDATFYATLLVLYGVISVTLIIYKLIKKPTIKAHKI